MRIGINLSSEPFRRDRPILVGATALGVIMLGLLAMLITLAAVERSEAAESRTAITRLETRLRAMAAEQTKLEATLRRPENAEVLDKVVFINALLYRKGISWTKVFSDVEGVLPFNVRLISVRPQVNARNEVLLDMVVACQSQAPVIEMLKNLEKSPVFGSTVVHSWLPPAQTEPLFRYRVSVNYGQKL